MQPSAIILQAELGSGVSQFAIENSIPTPFEYGQINSFIAFSL